jgi:group I intron endonuclease
MEMQAYIAVNKLNGKGYVGITTRSIDRRWNEHITYPNCSGQLLHKAIEKYGQDAFEVHHIASAIGDLSNLKAIEKTLIQQFQTYVPNGYNLTLGGDGVYGFKKTPEQIEKWKLANIGRKASDETKQKMVLSHLGENNHFFGKNHSEESKQKISESKKGSVGPWLGKPRSEETKQKISRATKGISRPHTEDTKRKMSLSHQGKKQASPDEETRKKISESVKKSWALRRQTSLTKGA